MTTEVDFELVDTEVKWKRCLEKLAKVPRMAVDLEANSLYAYRERICLIQISTDKDHFIIDPLSDITLKPLGRLMNDPAVEKIFHAADYDLTLLRNLYEWRVTSLFDTMWAGRLLGFSKMGLAWFLETLYDIHLNKKHQKADWGKRPLTQEKLVYACNDTRYLLQMRDDLGQQLAEKGLEAEAAEIFETLCRSRVVNRSFDPDGFWKLPGVHALPPREQAVVKALFIFRDNEAKRRDVPPFKVFNNQMLMRLAQAGAKWNGKVPKNACHIGGVPDKIVNRLNPRLFEVIRKALNGPVPKRPDKKRQHSSGYWQRHQALMEWRKKEAGRRGVESDVVLGRETLEELAEKAPAGENDLKAVVTLGAWHRKKYGPSILQVLNR